MMWDHLGIRVVSEGHFIIVHPLARPVLGEITPDGHFQFKELDGLGEHHLEMTGDVPATEETQK